ncbi:hypothetical protein EBT25_17490 [bacterium]|jgi:hypothetical protein|nr:hypothetical protein [bacterium]
MKKLALVFAVLAGSAQAQIIIYQQQQIVSPYQGPLVNNPCGPECWAAKKYGPQYTHINQVPQHIRDRVDNPSTTVISVVRPVVIPTAPASQPLPGQSWEDQQRMQQMSR